MKGEWTAIEAGWYVYRVPNHAVAAAYQEGSKWCAYVTTDRFPGDGLYPTLKEAKAAVERMVREV